MSTSIGGFFGLETLLNPDSRPFHTDGLLLSNGRAGFRLLLQSLKPTRLHVPYFTCDALLTPLAEEGIPFTFYRIDKHFSPVSLPAPGPDEYIVYINYFGLCNSEIDRLYSRFGQQLIVDNTQAFFYKAPAEASHAHFNSMRKFFGVPDGGYLFPSGIQSASDFPANLSISFNHLTNRILGNQEAAYSDFLTYEDSIVSEVRLASAYTQNIASYIDYPEIIRRRRENYQYLHSQLGPHNVLDTALLQSPENNKDIVPFAYPFLTAKSPDRKKLYAANIFVPTFWPEVHTRDTQENFEIEKLLAGSLLPLPVDHRYGLTEMNRIASFIINSLL